MAYTIVIGEDNYMMVTNKQRIMQRSKLVDDLWFLVYPTYNGLDMSDYVVQLEYVLPCSRKYCTEILNLSSEKYKDYLKYQLPVDTKLTTEAGAIELQLTFAKADLNAEGVGIQRVRKATGATIDIVPISAWADIIPDSALSALDQRLIKMDAQMRAMNDIVINMDATHVDDLVYDANEETLQLSANGIGVGTKIPVRDILEDGIPVVDINGVTGGSSADNGDCSCGCEHEDSVVEFGYGATAEIPEENDSIVEF
jgi:hypothetical protein